MKNADFTLLTTDQTAERLGKSVSCLEKWRTKRKHLQFYRIGGAVRYKSTDIDAYIDAHSFKVRG